MLKTASEVIAQGDTKAVVDFAIEANREVTATSRELNKAKAHLREDARKGSDRDELEGTSVDIGGNLGTATVVFDSDTPKTRKGQDLKGIEPNLSEETFARLFTKEVVVKPVKDFLDHLGELSSAERAVVTRFIEIKPTTPKVYLPK
jgi:hypothetical protein